jgi:multidrug efflux pump subunit AcrA (membrane-fusion protein)
VDVPRVARKTPRWVLPVVIVALLAIAARWFVPALSAGSGGTAGTAWATGTAAVGDITVTVTGTGALEPGAVEEVHTGVAGTVRKVRVREGDAVTKGQALAEIENESVILALEQARLTCETESELLAEMQSGLASSLTQSQIRTAELKVESARLALQAKEKQAAALTVRADAAGTVSWLEVAVGEDVAEGGTLLSLLEGPYAQVQLQVPEDRIAEVRTGSKASVILGSLPQVHLVNVSLSEMSIYGLKVGDKVRGTVTGEWVPGTTLTVYGTVTDIEQSGSMFVVTCRLPGLPVEVLPGARISAELYPSGREDGVLAIYGGGTAYLGTDEKTLNSLHAEGKGLKATVTAIASQGVKDASGVVTFAVTLRLDEFPQGGLAGMSAHAWLPLSGDPVYALTSLETQTRNVTTLTGGTVTNLFVREGDLATRGQVLAVLYNDSVLLQLEQARNDLEVQEDSLLQLTRPQYTDREIVSQELKVRQAELTLAAQMRSAEALVVKAPRFGKVLAWNSGVEPGRDIATGVLCCRIASYDAMQLTIQVDELEVDLLREGMGASVRVDALPGKSFPATVGRISQEGVYQQGVSKFDVLLTMEGSAQLRSQMTSTAEIFVAEHKGVLLVPAEAVTFVGEGNGEVNVVEADGRVATKAIRIGLYDDAHVEVLEGIEQGAVVITGTMSTTGTGGLGGFRIPGTTVTPGTRPGGTVQPPTQGPR